MVRLDGQTSANCENAGLYLWLDSPRRPTALMIMRSLRESDPSMPYTLRCVEASISQTDHHVYTRHLIWNHDFGDAEREVAHLVRLDRGSFRQQQVSQLVLYRAQQRGVPQQQRR